MSHPHPTPVLHHPILPPAQPNAVSNPADKSYHTQFAISRTHAFLTPFDPNPSNHVLLSVLPLADQASYPSLYGECSSGEYACQDRYCRHHQPEAEHTRCPSWGSTCPRGGPCGSEESGLLLLKAAFAKICNAESWVPDTCAEPILPTSPHAPASILLLPPSLSPWCPL